MPNPSEVELPALVDASMPPDEQPMSHEPAINNQLPLFSEPEVIPDDAAQTQDASTATAEAEVSLAGTSAPLFTNPSLTDVPVSVSPLPDRMSNLQDTEASKTELSGSDEPAARYNVPSTRNRGGPRAARGSTRGKPSHYQDLRSRAQRQGRRGRSRGRPPRRPTGHTTTSSRQIAREIDTQPSITSDSDSEAPTLRSVHLMLTKTLHRLTHTMTYAVIEYLYIAVEPVGCAIALAFWL